MRKCPKCGARNDAQALMCTLCNERLGGASAAESYEPRLWNDGKQRRRNEEPDEAPAPAIGKPLHTEGTKIERHFLVPPLGDALRLDFRESAAVVIGRDEGCDIQIASGSVSRRHAELRVKGEPPKVHISDAGSQNGTFVNDERVHAERALEDGDVVRLGDLQAIYRKLAVGEDDSKLKKRAGPAPGTETVRMEGGGGAGSEPAALEGDASLLSIDDVLRKLHGLQATGLLQVDMSGTKGTIKMQGGIAVDGSYAGLEGVPAVKAMAALKKGRYRFEPERAASAPTMKLGTGELSKTETDKFTVPPKTPSGPNPAPRKT